MLCGGKTHTAHQARVRHAWDARLEAGRVFVTESRMALLMLD